jgi:hypothetical protein
MDGAQLTSDLGHLTGGVKIVDPRAVDPLTGNLLALVGKFQSRDLSFMSRLAFVKDNKVTYRECFQEFFLAFNGDCFVIPATESEPELSNFEINSCQDLSSGWKTTQLGGGCKSTKFFCPHCMVSRNTMCDSKLTINCCNLCTGAGCKRCYCHNVVDSVELQQVKAKVSAYVNSAFDDGFTRFDGIQKQSKMLFDASIADKERNPNHIDFQPTSRKEGLLHSKLLVHELKIRFPERQHKERLSELLMMSVEEKIDTLKQLAAIEFEIGIARMTVDRHLTTRELAIALAVEKLVPCILHMKLRITEKIFHCIINSGLERYGDSKFDCKKRKAYEALVTECMRNKVFGNEDSGRVSQWKFRWKSGNRAMEKPSLSGAACNKILGGLQALAKTIFSAELDEEPDSSGNSHVVRVRNEISLKTWTKIASNLVPMWKLIEQHNDFSDNDLLQLHFMSNAFMCQWVDLYGLTHMTNYIHILGSGHLPYFAKKYGNLYRFSQQGWEAVNQLLKHYYFNNTNHGGSAGNGGKDSDGNYTCSTIFGRSLQAIDEALPEVSHMETRTR